MIDQKTIEDIRFKADIVDIIGRHVSLRKRGSNYIGLCPFHQEKTPSFIVSPEKGIWHCFGCQKGGNVYSFVMELEKLTFVEAVHTLGEIVGIKVEDDHYNSADAQKNKGEKEELTRINEKAKIYFQNILQNSNEAKQYITERRLSPEIVEKFELGFASDSWSGLLDYLKEFNPERISAAGLAIKKENGTDYYDRFRRRLMFPVKDVQGRVIAFSGRIITNDKEQAKYVNSPETQIFNKGSNLYGLNLAKSEIKSAGFAVLVEGQMDVLACHAAGVTNAIASLGTAFTPNQARLLARYTKSVVLAFDSDSAGREAMDKSAALLNELGFKLKSAQIAAKDLDELLNSSGAPALQNTINAARNYYEDKLERILKAHDLKDIAAKAAAVQETLETVKKIEDRVERDYYIEYTARQLRLNPEVLQEELVGKIGKANQSGQVKYRPKESFRPVHKYEKAEKMLLRLLLEDNKLRPEIFQNIDENYFDEQWRAIAKIMKLSSATYDIILEDRENLLSAEQKKQIAGIILDDTSFLQKYTLTECLSVLQERKLNAQKEQLRIKLQEAEKNGDEQMADQLVKSLAELK